MSKAPSIIDLTGKVRNGTVSARAIAEEAFEDDGRPESDVDLLGIGLSIEAAVRPGQDVARKLT